MHAQEQITVKTLSSIKTRLDAIGLDAEGNVVINEFKSSATAPLTPNQKIAFPEIRFTVPKLNGYPPAPKTIGGLLSNQLK